MLPSRQAAASADAGPTAWRLGSKPSLVYTGPLDLCLADYTALAVSAALSPEIYPRAVRVYYRLDGQGAFDTLHAVDIPLVLDGEMHEYSYELKLLDLPQGVRLIGIRLDPVAKATASGENRLEIADLRLIRGDKPPLCAR